MHLYTLSIFIRCITSSKRFRRDASHFAYPDTPLFIANALLMLVIIYITRKGIEAIARSGELLFIFMYFLAVAGFILIISSGLIDFKNLQPVLKEGVLLLQKLL